MFTTTTTDGLGFTHTVILDDASMLKFFAGLLVTTILLILMHKLTK